MKRSELQPSEEYEATYCPEDDKLRLYVGRVPREEYEFLRAEGWTSTPKQSCDFVAVWTPSREATAIQYAGFIGDEDTPPTERAADRAERFEGYREKRTAEAIGHAGRLEGGSLGFQSQAKAEREERKLDRLATKAGNQWDKAEHWQRRTAGVISHALHKSSPAVRMGRIKVLESELRKREKEQAEWLRTWKRNKEIASNPEPLIAQLMGRFHKGRAEAERTIAEELHGSCAKLVHPRKGGDRLYIFELLKGEDPVTLQDFCSMWLEKYPCEPGESSPMMDHIKLRLAYENQMLEAQGGRAASVEMEPGGWLGSHQIHKVNKSTATGRVVSVELRYMSEVNQYGRPWSDGKGPRMLPVLIKTERLEKHVYRPPTDEERAAFAAAVQEQKKEAKAKSKAKKDAGEDCPLVNPTDDDAAKLQEMWNESAPLRREKPGTVKRMTQAQYSANSSGTYARFKTVVICETGNEHRTRIGQKLTRCDVFKVRKCPGGYGETDSVIIITDKPQKPVPWRKLEDARKISK